VSGTSYTDALRTLIIDPTKIADLYYYPDIYPRDLRVRTVEGYYFNHDEDSKDLAPLLGKSVRDYSVSWAQSAGAIESTPHALALWARDLYQGPILTKTERYEMETLVSATTGKPIVGTSPKDPRGFGLGASQMYRDPWGRFWFYEGITLGYRMMHAYFPKQNVVIALGLNSQTGSKEDHIGALVSTVIDTLEKYKLF
jgi:D-alanyl-D-alanine carboxypeptidase